MTSAHAAIAVYVKTPGLSPIKTRLAEQIGPDAAERFYELSVAAVEATVAKVSGTFFQLDVQDDVRGTAGKRLLAPYWAVAEQAGLADPRWQRFPRVWQGSGDLGDRLGRVFGDLREQSAAVIAIGADSPQIRHEIIRHAVEHLVISSDNIHVLGRCHDGGFYLVGTNVALPRAVWQDVPYGTAAAADRLAANLVRHGSIIALPTLTDVDRAGDLQVLHDELTAIADPSSEQLAVLDWVRETRTPNSNDE